MKKQGAFQITFFIIMIISTITIIFLGTEYLFHSDDATAILVAREQILNKSILLKEWNHGTSIWTIGLQTFIIPFMLFLKDWILCRQLAVILQIIIFLIVGYKIMKELKISNPLFYMTLFLVPLSEEVLEHTFFQATYMNLQLFCYVVVAILMISYKKVECRKSAFVYGIVGVLIITLTCHSNLMSISTSTLPIFGAIIIYYVIENFALGNTVVPKKKVFYIVGVLIVGTLIAVGMYWILCKITGFDVAGVGVNEFLGKYGYALELNHYLDEFLLLYGGTGEAKLFSVEGILRVARLIWSLLFGVITPCLLVKNYKKMAWEQRLFFIYSILTFIILSMVALVTGKCSSRYFLPVYYNNIILFGILCKSMEEKFQELIRIIHSVIAIVAIGCCSFYITYDYQVNKNDIGMWRSNSYVADKGLVEFLTEQKIGFMYAPYWSAYSNMVVSDGQLQAMAYSDNEPMKTKQWLNSERWCSPEYYNGRTAVVFSAAVAIDSIYWELASEYLQYENWNILVFDKNLLLYDELLQRKEELNKYKENTQILIVGKELKYAGNAELSGNSLYLYKGGIQKGNFCDLEAGEYSVTIQGNNLENMSVMSYYLDEEAHTLNIQMKDVQKAKYRINYNILVDEKKQVGFCERNEMEEIIKIDSISVEKIKHP